MFVSRSCSSVVHGTILWRYCIVLYVTSACAFIDTPALPRSVIKGASQAARTDKTRHIASTCLYRVAFACFLLLQSIPSPTLHHTHHLPQPPSSPILLRPAPVHHGRLTHPSAACASAPRAPPHTDTNNNHLCGLRHAPWTSPPPPPSSPPSCHPTPLSPGSSCLS